MSELIRKAARKWFYESFDCDLLAQMQAKGLIAQAEGFSVSVMAELELEMERAFLSFQVELEAIKAERDALQQRMAVEEKRTDELEALLRMFIENSDDKDVVELCSHALNPVASPSPVYDQWEK